MQGQCGVKCRDDEDNSRACTLSFTCSNCPAIVHGFAGYFTADLYKRVTLSTVPESHTPDMHSWFPIFFPLQTPVRIEADQTLTFALWRIVRGSKVWRSHLGARFRVIAMLGYNVQMA
jgi:type II protein arginine methyltransferase